MPTPSLAPFRHAIARVFAALAMAFAPCVIAHDHAVGWKFELACAHANEGNGGNNGNGGNGNGNNGNGDGGNSGGNGNGNSSGNNNGESGNSGSGGAAANSSSNSRSQTDLAAGDKVTVQGNTVEVVHPDGIRESIKGGRFTMKDALGRTIVDRAAKAADVKRLKGF